MQIPASNLRSDSLHRFVGNRRTEVDEVFTLTILRSPRPKCVAEKIELLVWIGPSPVIILAIDDLRLFRMKFQSAFFQTRSYGLPYPLSLRLCPAMHDGIISKPFKRCLRKSLRHPSIKYIVQEQIG